MPHYSQRIDNLVINVDEVVDEDLVLEHRAIALVDGVGGQIMTLAALLGPVVGARLVKVHAVLAPVHILLASSAADASLMTKVASPGYSADFAWTRGCLATRSLQFHRRSTVRQC